jgi:hypothetical protein
MARCGKVSIEVSTFQNKVKSDITGQNRQRELAVFGFT